MYFGGYNFHRGHVHFDDDKSYPIIIIHYWNFLLQLHNSLRPKCLSVGNYFYIHVFHQALGHSSYTIERR